MTTIEAHMGHRVIDIWHRITQISPVALHCSWGVGQECYKAYFGILGDLALVLGENFESYLFISEVAELLRLLKEERLIWSASEVYLGNKEEKKKFPMCFCKVSLPE